MGTIHAIYEDGVFKPTQPVALPEPCEVEFEPRVVVASRLEQELSWLANRSAEAIEEARRRLFALTPPPTPIPEGKTLSDMVEGKWPGDETEEQVREALERLS
jgi:predicted DNA-binding antitoxin AbrB/MazE fold protein